MTNSKNSAGTSLPPRKHPQRATLTTSQQEKEVVYVRQHTHPVDVLNYIERVATPTQLRSIGLALAFAGEQGFSFNEIPLINVERFILTSGNSELRKIENAVKERRTL